MSHLALKYKYDASFDDPKLHTDDFGRLNLFAETERHSASGGFWVQWQDVREFGEALAAYPILPDKPIVAQWGFDQQKADDLILRIEIAPADTRGNLLVRFVIADDADPETRTRASFVTNYPDLATFGVSIAQLMNREIEEAVLRGQ